MDNLLGLLRIRIKRGIDLVIRDFRSSDPYCILKLGEQKLKTRIIYKDLNPVWDEDLTLSIESPDQPVELVCDTIDRSIFSFCLYHKLFIECGVIYCSYNLGVAARASLDKKLEYNRA
ncbi:putative C2 domain-containing protein [Helianthus anomalus]